MVIVIIMIVVSVGTVFLKFKTAFCLHCRMSKISTDMDLQSLQINVLGIFFYHFACDRILPTFNI